MVTGSWRTFSVPVKMLLKIKLNGKTCVTIYLKHLLITFNLASLLKLTYQLENDSSLMLLHINIRSSQKNFDLLQTFLASLTFFPHVICISETRTKHQQLTTLKCRATALTTLTPRLMQEELACLFILGLHF